MCTEREEVTADSQLHKYLPKYQSDDDFGESNYKSAKYGKPAAVFAPAHVTGEDILSTDEYQEFKEAVDDSVPFSMASAGVDSIPSAEVSEKRSANTLVDKTPQVRDVGGLSRDITPSYVTSRPKEVRPALLYPWLA